ncbi:MAG: hypothetical protein LW714_08670 [Oxalobacteraceae bacterium]|nr:hypothetical protein [Oxalobacteraceae bacterium]
MTYTFISILILGFFFAKLEIAIEGDSIMLFWVSEDFLWFLLNPAFGFKRFTKTHANWHKQWVGGAPVEYWLFTPLGVWLLYLSYT